jgi:DNA-binding NarL/FixJ family response regulator
MKANQVIILLREDTDPADIKRAKAAVEREGFEVVTLDEQADDLADRLQDAKLRNHIELGKAIAAQKLSAEEFDVYAGVVDGLSDEAIAEKEDLSLNGVSRLLASIKSKLGVTNREGMLRALVLPQPLTSTN